MRSNATDAIGWLCSSRVWFAPSPSHSNKEGTMSTINEISGIIVDAAIKIHRIFGPGLLESVYEAVMRIELEKRGLEVKSQVPIPLEYEGVIFENAFRLDHLVEERVIVEYKSVETMAPVHGMRLLTYLRLTNQRVGLLINFGAPTLKEGLRRIVNGLDPSDSLRPGDHSRANSAQQQ